MDSQTSPSPISDIWGLRASIQPTKRALVSYITAPFTLTREDPRNIQFSNTGIAKSIVHVLNELGYIVDVIEWTDTTFVPKGHYDLFIGHGGRNFEPIIRGLPPGAVKIYFSTGLYWQEHNRREEERFRWLEVRRGVRLPYDRWIEHSEESANQSADGIICLGNQTVKDSYSKFPLVINLNNAAYHDDRYDHTRKDFASGRKNFLFYSGGGNIHKGLDLLLEAFVQTKAHLYVCQEIRPDFHRVYRHELEDFPNIHLMGFLPQRSTKFYELVDRCNYAISLSCSEGSPGGVVECMHQGLISIVSRESNIDTDDYGVTLSTCNIDEILEVVNGLSGRSPEWCEDKSRRTRKVALADFSEDAFLANMKKAIEKTVSSERRLSTRVHPFFVDEHLNVSTGIDAASRLQSKSDDRFMKGNNGVTQVDMQRWQEAQRYERRTWMTGWGRQVRDDRNSHHAHNFDHYAVLKGVRFDNAIELGCGPFTNISRILKHVECGKVTLLDPLIRDYLTHPHSAYRHGRLGGIFGSKVTLVSEPIEDFSSDQTFDLVVIINVLEHSFSVAKVFERILALMPQGGVLIFHDKLIPNEDVDDLVHNIYDAGHPLRIGQNTILDFLSNNYDPLLEKHVPIPTEVYTFDSIYFIGRRR